MIVEIFVDAQNTGSPEYITLFNPSESPLIVSGYEVTRGFTHTIKPMTILNPKDTLFLTKSDHSEWAKKNYQV
ncbi:MAG: hypothetical protein JXQ90_05840 [Cyclobacteriaceae bacterium]